MINPLKLGSIIPYTTQPTKVFSWLIYLICFWRGRLRHDTINGTGNSLQEEDGSRNQLRWCSPYLIGKPSPMKHLRSPWLISWRSSSGPPKAWNSVDGLEEIRRENHLGCIKSCKMMVYLPYQLVSRVSEPSLTWIFRPFEGRDFLTYFSLPKLGWPTGGKGGYKMPRLFSRCESGFRQLACMCPGSKLAILGINSSHL